MIVGRIIVLGPDQLERSRPSTISFYEISSVILFLLHEKRNMKNIRYVRNMSNMKNMRNTRNTRNIET